LGKRTAWSRAPPLRLVTYPRWTYDFGPQVLMRFAFLENGVVTRVETGSHGYAR
jgi:hypothetical protein